MPKGARVHANERDRLHRARHRRKLGRRRTIPTFEIDEQVYIGFREELFEAKVNQAARKYL
jgi:hypothetical protein